MTIRLELQGGDNAANALDLTQLKDLTQNMHVSDLLEIVKAHKASQSIFSVAMQSPPARDWCAESREHERSE